MFSLIKDFLSFAYKATDNMEEKSKKFAEEREKRMDAFRKERDEEREKMGRKMERRGEEVSDKLKSQFREMVKEAGLASRDEIEDIKARITDISEKLEKKSK